MNKLVILRHGESLWNKENKFTGWMDIDLSKNGVKEAKSAGELLQSQGFSFDIAYTSLLLRAKNTLKYCLSKMDVDNINIFEDWRLNERHYGSLQGLNKKETVKIHGEKQVLIWRRSYDSPPPKLPKSNDSHPCKNVKYSHIESSSLPSSESLKDVINRFLPLWNEKILKDIKNGKKILIVAHGNSLRALYKLINDINAKDIINFNIPTGIPMIIEFNNQIEPINNFFLGNEKEIQKKIKKVINQGLQKG